jgi:hypothetical protein
MNHGISSKATSSIRTSDSGGIMPAECQAIIYAAMIDAKTIQVYRVSQIEFL